MSEPAWVALGAQPVDYAGDWAAGTQYAPGDVVRYGGVDYLAVNPSLGVTPPAAVGLNVPYTSYVPAWTAGTNPAIGNGTLSGRYNRVGRQIHAIVELVMGSTTTYGVGTWFLTVPFAPSGGYSGSWVMYDASANAIYSGAVRAWTSPTFLLGLAAGGALGVDATRPVAWASPDSLTVDVLYEAAA